MANSFLEEDQVQEIPPPTHNPLAPPHELFEITTAVDPSYIISLIRKLLPSDENKKTEGVPVNANHRLPENGGESEAMEYCENYGKADATEETNADATEETNADATEETNENQSSSEPVRQETWEECGCVLWDLSASEDHAQFMIQNLILQVLLANLMVSQSSRVTEISLGIIGNLACHEISRKQITSICGLVEAIVQHLLIDDVPGLCEALRVMTLCLQGSEGVIWAKALQSEQLLSRILWIVENALNPQLIEKSVGLLLAVLESQQEVSTILLPHMMKLDLSSLLVNLFSYELSKFRRERITDRYALLDLILRTIEALSVLDDYSQQICLNKELLQLLKELIKLPDKTEIASTCVTAAVLIANMLTDAKDLALELSQDLNFLQGLFDVFPFASDDTEAQSAIWSICARLLALVKQSDMSPSKLHLLVSILIRNLDLVEGELLFLPLDHEQQKTAASSDTRMDARVIAMKGIYDILNLWKALDDGFKNAVSSREGYISEIDVDKLLDLCCKASSM